MQYAYLSPYGGPSREGGGRYERGTPVTSTAQERAATGVVTRQGMAPIPIPSRYVASRPPRDMPAIPAALASPLTSAED